MSYENESIWFNGKQVPWHDAKVHVLTHGLHYGTGVFEGIRAYKCVDGTSAVFRLPEHVKRLIQSAKIIGFEIPFTEAELTAAIIETLEVNKLVEGYIRPLSFVGEGVLGVLPVNPINTIVAVWPWGAYLGAEALEKGIRVKTSSYSRNHVNGMMTKSKASGNYVNSVLAKIEVKKDGYDEALLLDTQGYVAEGSGENFFMVRNGKIKTPPLTSILDGITRDTLITLAQELGYTVIEQPFTRDEVYTADEAFFSGTAAELTPIRELDNRTIGAGVAGPITKALQKAYFAAVKGDDANHKAWLTPYTV